jgi:hypothetical protein
MKALPLVSFLGGAARSNERSGEQARVLSREAGARVAAALRELAGSRDSNRREAIF